MTKSEKMAVEPADGRLGVLIPGLGAVATTFLAGVMSIRKGENQPIGSLSEMGRMRLGKRTENRIAPIKEVVPLTDLNHIVFGGWDIYEDNAYESASRAGVLDQRLLDSVQEELSNIKPMPAVFDTNFVKLIDGPNKKSASSKFELAQALRKDIQDFKSKNKCDRIVMVWCGSTESHSAEAMKFKTIDEFEGAMKENDPSISPAMMYTYAAISEGVPYANGAPNLSVELPSLQNFAKQRGVPLAGSDFKTGQTLMKTIIAPGLKARMLGIDGWFSTNILGNRDGEVLQDPGSFKSKEVSKLGVLEQILEPELYPNLYGDLDHLVRINYYPPRGDNKEGWDNIDIKGWLGYPMQIKVNFLCRDSILAAPIVLDLVQFLDLAKRANMGGIQEWLSFYWKSPMALEGLKPVHDINIQLLKLQNTLRYIGNEELIHHLGLSYYGYDEG